MLIQVIAEKRGPVANEAHRGVVLSHIYNIYQYGFWLIPTRVLNPGLLFNHAKEEIPI